MGTTVLNATAATSGNLDPDIRVFAHCGPAPSLYAAASGANPLGMILININVTVRTVAPDVKALWILLNLEFDGGSTGDQDCHARVQCEHAARFNTKGTPDYVHLLDSLC